MSVYWWTVVGLVPSAVAVLVVSALRSSSSVQVQDDAKDRQIALLQAEYMSGRIEVDAYERLVGYIVGGPDLNEHYMKQLARREKEIARSIKASRQEED